MKRPSKQQIKNGTYKYVGDIHTGGWYKICTGPAHEQPEYLPATEKYFYVHKRGKDKGRFVARCRLCINWSKVKSPGSYDGLVPISVAQRFFVEASNRIGAMELARRANISRGTVYKVLTATEGNIQKKVLRKVMLELTSIQRHNERSISNGAKWRAQQRLHHNYDVCKECGTPKSNFTLGCGSCVDRFYGYYKRGSITREEWIKIKEQIRPSS